MERQRQEMMNQQADLIRRQTEAAMALETALRLARGSQEAPPQQQASPKLASRAREERVRTPDRRTSSRTEAPPAGSACKEERPPQGEQQARSPRRRMTDDQVLSSRGREPSATRRPSDVYSAARPSFHPPNEPRRQERQDHHQRQPDEAGRRRNSHGSRYQDGHDRYEGESKYYQDAPNYRLTRSADNRRNHPREPQGVPHQNQRPAKRSAGGS